jgi:Ca-activated chloride channel family protein
MKVFSLCTLLAAALLAYGAAHHSPHAFARQQDARPTPSPTPTPAAEDEVERVEVDLVSVLLTAMDRERRFVNTLRPEDVRLTEDGREQQLTVFQRETDLPVSLAVVVDTSASQDAVMEDEKAAARTFVDSVMRPGKDSVAVLSFTGVVRLERPLMSDPVVVRAAIDPIRVVYKPDSPECDNDNPEVTEEQDLRCRTAVWDAVWIAVEEVLSKTPESTRRAVVLLSDGDDTASRHSREGAADFAVRHNTVVYSIGIRDEEFEHGSLRRDELRKLSERTGGRAFFPADRAELAAAFAQIDQELRSQYLLAYTPTNRARDGRRRQVRIELTNPALRKQKLRLLYRQSYYARPSG